MSIIFLSLIPGWARTFLYKFSQSMELLDLFRVSEVRILPESGAQLWDEMVVGIGIIASKTMKLTSLIISIHTSLNRAMDRKRSGFTRGSIAQM